MSDAEFRAAVLDRLDLMTQYLAQLVTKDTGVRRRPLTGDERRILSVLLPALTGEVKVDGFLTARTLHRSPTLKRFFGKASVKAIGKFLSAAEGIAIGDLVIQDAGELKECRLYRLAQVSAPLQSRTKPESRQPSGASKLTTVK